MAASSELPAFRRHDRAARHRSNVDKSDVKLRSTVVRLRRPSPPVIFRQSRAGSTSVVVACGVVACLVPSRLLLLPRPGLLIRPAANFGLMLPLAPTAHQGSSKRFLL